MQLFLAVQLLQLDWRGLFLFELAMQTEELILFVDDKNVYHGARRAFFEGSEAYYPHYYGQINPVKLGKLICERPPKNKQRVLKQVRLYTGSPDATREPKAYSAHTRQCNFWKNAGVEVIARTLKYPDGWPVYKAEQKGIDVALAVDFVTLAVDREYDVGVIVSTDTDLKPAIEYVLRKCSGQCYVEVAAWRSQTSRSRLSVSGGTIWCHWLDINDYNYVADLIDYNV